MKSKNAFAYVFVFVLILLLLAAILQPVPKNTHTGSGHTSSYSTTSGYRPRSTPKPTPKPTAKPVPKPTATPGTSRRSVLPSPSTDGFYSAEDFYEWNIDDFSDYEEAEEYYNSHDGW